MLPLVRAAEKVKKSHLGAFVTFRTDHHLNEYLPPAAEHLAWLTGFTGSAGLLIITPEKTGLFVDGRYATQAPQQVHPGVCVHSWNWKEIKTFLHEHVPHAIPIGIDADHLCAESACMWRETLSSRNPLSFISGFIDEIWDARPPWPCTPFVDLDESFSGAATATKLAKLQQIIHKKNADALVVSNLCALAWLLNIRGSDLEHTPVSYAYAFVPATGNPVLFTRSPYTGKAPVDKKDYDSFVPYMGTLQGLRLLLDPCETTEALWQYLHKAHDVIPTPNPVVPWKAQKNTTEIQGFRDCHIQDSLALCETFAWIHDTHTHKRPLSEISIEAFMNEHRRQKLYNRGLSFDPIVGWNANGAIIHYRATPHTNAGISGNGLLLIDSGGQYKNGTTDVTRTLALGCPTPDQISDYTHVLKGMIHLSQAHVDEGTSGMALDTLARTPIIHYGQNYAHGTGHGVGHSLSVHEGPFHISPRATDVGLKPGMVLSNEPGIYHPGKYGIRIENLMVALRGTDDYIVFETLTQVPLDRTLIDKNILTPEEIAWVNAYHAGIISRIQEHLTPRGRSWLTQACAIL
ncbi:MAG: aminopeptidase P family protein [Alphaproteobacteria bacterium]|nr:MAG: aminopeptidase P family protein [Alphaproteobacteria bacterium]